MHINQLTAEKMLVEELAEYEKAVLDAVTISLDQCMFDALVSWTYNLGPTNLNSSTLLKVLNSGEYADVPAQLKRWNKAGGKVLDGLIRRREAEALLFENKDWSSV
jgi:lysozyme